ncbi:MAG: Peptidase protein [Thermoproteota archaeon]|nr:Peptidase protein [Thermoproteota archaeon]
MPFCPKCGTSVQEDAAYCPNCGTQIIQKIAPATSPQIQQSFLKISDIVKTEFEIESAYLEDGTPTFIVAKPINLEEKAENLSSKLRLLEFEVKIEQSSKGIKLQVLDYKIGAEASRKFFGVSLHLILLIATVITVSISGYLTVSSYINVLSILGEINSTDKLTYLIEMTALYTLSIMSIVGLHELGHFFTSRRNHVQASLPLFIPGIPGITPGTFGAVILQKSPVRNRDQLFDIGISGPLVGFIISVIVSVVGYSISLPLTSAQYNLVIALTGPSQSINLPLIFSLLEPYLLPQAYNAYVFFLSPLAYAGWIGTLITFLNVFPVGQLDGGHVARAVLGSKLSNIVSYIMVVVMFLTGWWTMAIFVMLLMGFKHPGTLNDVSPLSNRRKILAILLPVIFISCLTLNL